MDLRRNERVSGNRWTIALAAACAWLAPAVLASGCAATGSKGYGTPEAATEALVAALRTHDLARLQAVLGPGSGELLSSGDEVADRADVDDFVEAYDETHALLMQGDDAVLLVVGPDQWPLPLPLVRNGDAWRFDLERGREEILSRRIGRNELSAIEVCRAIVDAEHEYASLAEGQAAGTYAARFMSTPGQHDGLYWPAAEGAPESPLGPLVADAESEGYFQGSAEPHERQPYHGYYYRILTAQGPFAPGGASSYLVDGRLTGGFAILAEPSSYGNSGVMTFIVGPAGVLYQRDLGPDTTRTAAAIQAFDPDASWTLVRE